MPALRMHLRREARRQRILVAADCLGAIVGIAAALWAFSQKSAPGRFYGAMMLVTTLVCIGLSVWVHATRAGGDMESLVGMLDLASSGARKRQRFGRSLFMSAWFLLPVAVLIPFGAHLSFGHSIFPVVWVGGWSAALAIIGRRMEGKNRAQEARFEHLKRSLTASDGSPRAS